MPFNLVRIISSSAALALAGGLVAASGAVAHAAPAPNAGTDSSARQGCAQTPALRPERSPVPIRSSPGFSNVWGWGNACNRIELFVRDDGEAVQCHDGNVSTEWWRVKVFSEEWTRSGWVSVCDILM